MAEKDTKYPFIQQILLNIYKIYKTKRYILWTYAYENVIF